MIKICLESIINDIHITICIKGNQENIYSENYDRLSGEKTKKFFTGHSVCLIEKLQSLVDIIIGIRLYCHENFVLKIQKFIYIKYCVFNRNRKINVFSKVRNFSSWRVEVLQCRFSLLSSEVFVIFKSDVQ